MKDIVARASKFAMIEYEKNDAGHRWNHVEAVMKRALEIAGNLKEKVDYELLQLAVIFHDIDYNSEPTHEENHSNHVENSIIMAENFLRRNNYPEDRISMLKQVMLAHSTPHRKKLGDSTILEGKILYDADKSILITSPETYRKYSGLLYLAESGKLVEFFKNNT